MLSALLAPSHVSGRETPNERRAYWVITAIVAVAMFLAASGSGSGEYVTAEPPPDALNIAGNVFAATIGVLVLIPRTRIYGAILAVANMFVSMYLNYTYDGVDYFVDLIPYNVTTIMLASILIGHYEPDLAMLKPARHSAATSEDGSHLDEQPEASTSARPTS
ncbi:MAG: hypothetical protein AAF467_01160 [Actinomycetota bacterium]